MKKLTLTLAALLFCASTALAGEHHGSLCKGGDFTNKDFAGRYVEHGPGWASNAIGWQIGQAVGLWDMDGKGHFSGGVVYSDLHLPTGAYSYTEEDCTLSISGTYSVNPDGTGDFALTFTGTGGDHASCAAGPVDPVTGHFVIQDHNHVELIWHQTYQNGSSTLVRQHK